MNDKEIYRLYNFINSSYIKKCKDKGYILNLKKFNLKLYPDKRKYNFDFPYLITYSPYKYDLSNILNSDLIYGGNVNTQIYKYKPYEGNIDLYLRKYIQRIYLTVELFKHHKINNKLEIYNSQTLKF